MNPFLFAIPTQTHFGPGTAGQTGSILREVIGKPAGKVLVVLDPGLQGTPWLGAFLASLREAGFEVSLYTQVKPNPRDEDVYAAAALTGIEQVSALVAVGGGSAMDTAKAAALIAAYGGKITDFAGWGKVPGPVLPVITVPTTAGSGSENTGWAVITDSATHAKLSIGDRNLSPRAAVVDPLLTVSLPPGLTAATGMDALTHSVEAFISPLASPVNDLLALESIRLVAANLRQAVTNGGDLEARSAMMLAATLGGIAINNADVAGVHCLSEGMGALYDAPHGLLNAILLPYLMVYWLRSCPERFAWIAEAFGAPAIPVEAPRRVIALNRALRFPSLKEIGVIVEDIPRLAVLAEGNVSNPSNPRPMAAADYQQILEDALAGSLSE